jgi:hypothetical protein
MVKHPFRETRETNMVPGRGSLTIQEKIARARHLLDAWAGPLRARGPVRDSLERLRACIEASREVMAETGVVDQCRRCEEVEGGSCCGSGIENRYTEVLLLINLLLGVPLREGSERPKSCYFLGETGCSLLARHVLCVNYLCAGLRERLAPAQLSRLQDAAGEELETEFRCYETIKGFLNRRSDGPDPSP